MDLETKTTSELGGRSFEDAVAAIQGVDGWLTVEQARLLYQRAAALPPRSRVVEIGSHHGRSSIVLASAVRDGVEIVAVDPFARPERPSFDELTAADVGERDLQIFAANLDRAGVRQRIHHVRETSADALAHVPAPVDLLFIDGSHDFGPARSDIRDWGSRIRPSGTMLIHDSFSSIGVTLAQLVTLFPGSDFRYVGRRGSLAEYRRIRLTKSARMLNAARQALQLPWFARNVVVKLAIATGVRPLARVLGHTDETFPY